MWTAPSDAGAVAAAPESAADSATGTILQRADENGVEFEVIVPALHLEPVVAAGANSQLVRLPGYDYIGTAGAPDLPQQGVAIALPPGAVPKVTLIDQTMMEIADVAVAPAGRQELVAYDAARPDVAPVFNRTYNADAAIYDQNAFFPTDVVAIHEVTQIRGLAVATILIRPVQYNPQDHLLRHHSRLQIRVDFSYPNGRPAATVVPESDTFAHILAANVLNFEQARAWQGPMTVMPELGGPPQTSPCMDNNALRIATTQTGIHAMSYAELSAAGFPTGVAESKIRMCHMGDEIAIRIEDNNASSTFGSGDNVIFYGEAIKTQETATNIYWLTYSSAGADGLRMGSIDGTPAGAPTPADYDYTLHVEQDLRYLPAFPMFPQEDADINDHWYWGSFGYNTTLPTTITITFTVDDPTTSGGDVNLTAELWGGNDLVNHVFRFKVNGVNQPIPGAFFGSGRWVDFRYLFNATFPASLLVDGSNTIILEAMDNDPGDDDSYHVMYLNWVEIEPRREFKAVGGRLTFTQPVTNTAFRYSTSGWTALRTVYDVSEAHSPTVITPSSAGGLTVFEHTSGATTSSYEIVTVAGRRAVASITPDTLPSPLLQDTSRQASYIIITDPAFTSALNPLITQRQDGGETVAVVYTQDIFDEFSYGLYDPEAIRRFLAYTAISWQAPAPTYVLLAGSGSYDHRNTSGDNGPLDNAVPVYLRSGVDNNIGETAADNQYVDFNGDDLAEMLLGRLPADNVTELTSMIDRILARENESPGVWRGTHLLVVDNGLLPPAPCTVDPAGDFFTTGYDFINDVFPSDTQFLNLLFYAPPPCYPNPTYPDYPSYFQSSVLGMTTGIYGYMNLGSGVVVYMGHSGLNFWAKEDFFNSTVAGDELTNADMPSIMLPMTCLEGQYQFPTTPGLSETLLKLTSGGAVASYAPTGLQVQNGHDFLLTGWYSSVFTDSVSTMGQAVYGAKLNLYTGTANYQDLQDTYMLLGDPAMDLNFWLLDSQVFLPAILQE